MQEETLLKMLGWHRQSNDSQQICSVLLCLYYVSICLLILGILNTQIHLSREPSLALQFFVLSSTTQNFTPLEPMDLSREMLSSLPHNFMYKNFTLPHNFMHKTSISINILFSGFSTRLSQI